MNCDTPQRTTAKNRCKKTFKLAFSILEINFHLIVNLSSYDGIVYEQMKIGKNETI